MTLEEINQELVGVLKELIIYLVGDNNEGENIDQVTIKFGECAKQSGFISALVFLMCNDPESRVRSLAAMLLRRKLNKSWKSLPDDAKNIIRQALETRMTNESDKSCGRMLMQVIAVVVKSEFSMMRPWDEMMNLMATTCKDANQEVVQVGVELLSTVCETAYEHLTPQYIPILALLNDVLNVPGVSLDTSIHAVEAFKALVPALGSDHMDLVRQMIPKCMAVTRMTLKLDMWRTSDMLETFESLVETEVAFISPFVKDIVIFALEITATEDESVCEETRIRSLSLLQYVISCKKKAILKHNLIEQILKVIWPIILESSDDDDDVGFIGDESDNQTPFSSCLQVVDEMALHLPPDKLFQNMLPLIQTCAESEKDSHKRGLLLTLACLTEGTSEYIKDNHMRPFVTLACKGAQSTNEQTRNAAMFAIGQFAEFLEPEICTYASEIMPILFTALQISTSCKGLGISRAYYALENFVENLDEELVPYLSQLMNYLTTRMRTTEDAKEKVMVVSALGALGNAAKDKLGPYMSEILTLLQSCLQTFNDKLDAIHTQALDTLGVFVRIFGKENTQLATDSLNLGISILDREEDDPEMRRAAFGLFSAVSSILEDRMEEFLPKIVPAMIKTVNSSDGVKLHYAENVTDRLAFLDDNEDGDEDEDADEGVEAFTVENMYMEEKTDACQALGDLAKHTKHAFLQYLQTSFDELRKQIEFPYAEVRKAAIASCGQFVMTAYQLAGEMFPSFLEQVYSLFCKIIIEDVERIVVMSTLYTLKEMIQTCGIDMFANKEHDLQLLMEVTLKVLNQQSACQDADEEYGDEEHQQAEYDEMLIEYCGELFPVLAEKIGPSFLAYFRVCTPIFLSKMKPTSSSTERSFAAGTLAETMDKFGNESSSEFIPEVLPKLIDLSSDKQAEVRNNAIFAIGVFMQRCDVKSAEISYASALASLSNALNKESKRFVIDNILGAVARMVMAHIHLVPIKQVIPVLIQHLPIQEDHDEDMPVYACLTGVLRHHDVVSDEPLRNAILQIMTQACNSNDISVDVRQNIELALKKYIDDGYITSLPGQ